MNPFAALFESSPKYGGLYLLIRPDNLKFNVTQQLQSLDEGVNRTGIRQRYHIDIGIRMHNVELLASRRLLNFFQPPVFGLEELLVLQPDESADGSTEALQRGRNWR